MCLGAGFGVGHWQATRGAGPLPRNDSPVSEVPVRASRGPLASAQVEEAATREESGPCPPEFQFVGNPPPEVRERALAVMRLDALRWLKNNGHRWLSISVFSGPNQGTINPAFARAYGLSSGDLTRLNKAVAAAGERLRSAQVAGTTATMGSNNKTISVDVPALPELGGALREEVQGAFQDVLGPDRWPFFQELSSEPFNLGLGRFGTMDMRMEIEPSEVPALLKVRTYHVTGSSSGSSESAVDWDGLERMAPSVVAALPEPFRRKLQGR